MAFMYWNPSKNGLNLPREDVTLFLLYVPHRLQIEHVEFLHVVVREP